MTPEERNTKRQQDPLFPYKTPDGYFDNLKVSIMEQIKSEEANKSNVVEVLRPYLYLVAMFIGLALFLNLLPIVEKKFAKDNIELRAEDATDEEYNEFLLDETYDDYWGTIIMENNSNDKNLSSSK